MTELTINPSDAANAAARLSYKLAVEAWDKE